MSCEIPRTSRCRPPLTSSTAEAVQVAHPFTRRIHPILTHHAEEPGKASGGRLHSSRPQTAAGPPRRVAFASAPSASSVVAMDLPPPARSRPHRGTAPSQTSGTDRGGGCPDAGSRVAGAAEGADGVFPNRRMLMILLPARPSRLNVISMPIARRCDAGGQRGRGDF
jgi:hypothetical protein